MITTSGDKGRIQNISLREIKGMIDSFKISKEKFVNDTYIANLDVIFNKKNTLKYLEKNNIFPSIPIKKKILLIPIIIDQKKDAVFLFSNNNFYKNWNKKKNNYHLLNYLLPSEDIEDLNLVQKNFRMIEDYDFKELIKKYDLEDYIITITFIKENELRVLSKINFNNVLKLDNQIFPNIDLMKEEDFYSVIDKLKTIYEDNWKKNNEINTSIKLPLSVSINSKDYLKTQKLETSLRNLDLVSDFYILKFDNENIIYRIIYNSSPLKFIDEMKKKNFDLIIKDKIWVIK